MDITKICKAGFKLTLLASFFFGHMAFALPEGGSVAEGSATKAINPESLAEIKPLLIIFAFSNPATLSKL